MIRFLVLLDEAHRVKDENLESHNKMNNAA